MSPARGSANGGEEKSQQAYRTIGEVAETLELPQHVLRFWESRFHQLRPLKRGGNRRYYRPEDVALLRAIKTMLYEEGFTIKGVQKRFREHGVKSTVETVLTQGDPVLASPRGSESTPSQTGETAATAGGADDRDALAEIRDELKALRRLLD